MIACFEVAPGMIVCFEAMLNDEWNGLGSVAKNGVPVQIRALENAER
jgi:hypothetical protein